jgi:hypothetical protein
VEVVALSDIIGYLASDYLNKDIMIWFSNS